MSRVYLLNEDGMTDSMAQVICKDEGKELQDLLEKNPDLLPGEQINPEDPRRWFLIKREIPVHDPGTGEQRWNIDFFFVDQEGIPTFVECKRFKDTRSRREVVGQMLEYAANGQFYWSKDTVRNLIADEIKCSLDEFIQSIESDATVSSDVFFEQIENNLREGQICLIFFLEEAPYELKSIVDFLNKQMERTEVLIVEAKQYEKNGLRIIVPRLFGYTEQARRIKKKTTVVAKGRKWDEGEFFNDAKNRLTRNDHHIQGRDIK